MAKRETDCDAGRFKLPAWDPFGNCKNSARHGSKPPKIEREEPR